MLNNIINLMRRPISHNPRSQANNNWPWTDPEKRQCCYHGCKLKPIDGTSHGYSFCEYHLRRNAKVLGWTAEHFFRKDTHLPTKPVEHITT